MEIIRGKIDSAQKVVIYGPEGIGKSTFAAQFPMPLFIDTEGSTKRLDVARFPKPSSWTMLLDEAQAARDDPGLCQTLVVDTADWAEQLCARHVCGKAQVSGIEGFGYGKGYVYLAEEFGKLLNRLEEIVERGINVAVTAHAKMRKFEQPDEMGAYDRWELKMNDKTRSLLKEWADIVLFANYKTITVKTESNKIKAQGGQRVMYTTHHPCWDAKNRHGLASELPFEYAAIAHCIPGGPNPLEASVPQASGQAPPQETLSEPAKPEPSGHREPPRNLKKPPLPDAIPKELADLMSANQVTEEEIRQAVSLSGYYPEDTPIDKYDPQFVTGVLVADWNGVLGMIQAEIRDLPFEIGG